MRKRRESEKIMLTLSDEAVGYLDTMRDRWGLTRSAFLEAVVRIIWNAPQHLRQELISEWMAGRPAPSERKAARKR